MLCVVDNVMWDYCCCCRFLVFGHILVYILDEVFAKTHDWCICV